MVQILVDILGIPSGKDQFNKINNFRSSKIICVYDILFSFSFIKL